jgi:NADPH2:quinone reductase
VRSETVLVRPNRLALHDLVEAVAEGRLRTRVADTMPLAEAAEAHRRCGSGTLRGKLVLLP